MKTIPNTTSVDLMDATPSQFVGGRSRHSSITLDYPVEFGGVTYVAIHLRRLTAGEVSAYVEQLREVVKDNPNATIRPPIFTDEHGAPLPEGLFDALDDDDAFCLDEAAEDFLPRRFRGDGAKPSAPEAGSDTEPTSSATSAEVEPS